MPSLGNGNVPTVTSNSRLHALFRTVANTVGTVAGIAAAGGAFLLTCNYAVLDTTRSTENHVSPITFVKTFFSEGRDAAQSLFIDTEAEPPAQYVKRSASPEAAPK